MKRTHQKGTKLEDVGDAWRIRYRRYVVDATGERRSMRLTEYFYKRDYEASKRLAERAAAEFMRRVNEGNTRPERATTFAEIAEKWKTLILSQSKVSSQETKECKIRLHLLPTFGAMRLVDITAEVVQRWVSAQTCAPYQTDGILRTMRSIWRYGRIWGYVEHNPFEGVKKPKIVKGNSYSYTPEQIHAILAEATGWKRLFMWVLAETGMRPGECAGLRRQDVGPRHLSIFQSVWNCQIQTPKTPGATRTVAISTYLAEALREHIESTRAYQLGLLFPSKTGRPLSTHGFMTHTLRPILKKLNIEPDKRAGLYAFKHGNTTFMDKIGIPLKVRQQRLGHSDPRITLEHYTHIEDGADLVAADRIGALLNPLREGRTQ